MQKAGILKNVTPHTLRHSYATGLLEAGVDLLTIGRLLGHKSFSTTMIYLHVRRTHLGAAPSPIDWLPVNQLAEVGCNRPENNGRESIDILKDNAAAIRRGESDSGRAAGAECAVEDFRLSHGGDGSIVALVFAMRFGRSHFEFLRRSPLSAVSRSHSRGMGGFGDEEDCRRRGLLSSRVHVAG